MRSLLPALWRSEFARLARAPKQQPNGSVPTGVKSKREVSTPARAARKVSLISAVCKTRDLLAEMAAKSSLIGLFGLLCLVLRNVEVFAMSAEEDSGSVVPLTEVRFRGETTAVAHRKLMQTLSPTQTSGTVASLCLPRDASMPANPLTQVYCSYNVTTSGAPATSLTVCTYNATGVLVSMFPTAPVPGEILPTRPAVSCPGSTVPNSCPALVQQNLADARAFLQQTLCAYAGAVSSLLCAYNATGASIGSNGRNCP
ncbi:hypothetical protein KFL_014180010, partial [Klebsormidium nitens]